MRDGALRSCLWIQPSLQRWRILAWALALAFAEFAVVPSLHAQSASSPPQLPEPFSLSIEVKRLPEPFSVTVQARRLALPEPFAVTVQVRRPTLPEPFAVQVRTRRMTLSEPFAVTVQARRLALPDPFAVTVQARRLALPEPFAVTVQARRSTLPEPFELTIVARRESCADPQKQIDAAVALIGRSALGAAETLLTGINAEQCPRLVPQITEQKTRITQLVDMLIAEADVAAKSCNVEALALAAGKLNATEHPRLEGPRSRVSSIVSALPGAHEALERANQQYTDGDFARAIESYGRAAALLDGVGGACPDLAKRIASGLDRARRTREAIDRIDTVLRSCDGQGMTTLLREVKTIADPHPLLAEKIIRLEKIAPTLKHFEAALARAEELYEQGDLTPAKSELRRLEAELKALGGNPDCPDLRDKIAGLRERIAVLDGDLRNADEAIRRCDPYEIADVVSQFRRNPYHRMIRAKIPELERARNLCVVNRVEADIRACNVEALRVWTDTVLVEDAATLKKIRAAIAKAVPGCLRDTANRNCKAQYGEGAVGVSAKGGQFTCGCGAGYDFNPSKTRCVSPQDIMAEGHDKCRAKYDANTIAIGHLGEGKFQCNCRPGFRWNADSTGCVSGRATPADGNRACIKDFGPGARALRQLTGGRWDCACNPNYKFNAKRTRCVPLTGDDGNAACRRQFGPASYATRYIGNGRWDCYTARPPVAVPQIPAVPGVRAPQQRCHVRRDGRPGLHCE